MKDKWDRINNYSQLIIAFCAITALGLSIYTNLATNELLQNVSATFESQATPLIKFDKYQWFTPPPELSCENPANGINVYYRNVSGVPVYIEDVQLDVFMGERPLFASRSESTHNSKEEIILTPGEKLATGIMRKDFGEIYSGLRGKAAGAGPNLNFVLSVNYRSMTTGKKYLYKGKIIVGDDCRFPEQQMHMCAGESIEVLRH